MDKHLIALDLDGTLLTDDKIISERTIRVLNAAKEAGHEIVIATGRPHRISKQYYHELELTTPMVNMNGAFVHHPKNKNWGIHHSPMPNKTAHEVLDMAYSYGTKNILAEIMDDVYVDRYHDDLVTNFFTAGIEEIATFGNLKNNLKEDPSSLLIYPKDEAVQQIEQALDEHHATIIDHRKWTNPFAVVEVIRSGLHKAVGLDIVAKDLGIPKDRIIAFGDEDNDLEMIEYAGIGVAMENGIDELKTLADQTTLSNEKDGVAHFLEEYFNLDKQTLSKTYSG